MKLVISRLIIALCCLPIVHSIQAQSAGVINCPYDSLSMHNLLKTLYFQDQQVRQNPDSLVYLNEVDSIDQLLIDGLLKECGWPSMQQYGLLSNYTVWLVIQHAPLSMQEEYLPLLRSSVESGKSKASHLALLEDRVNMRQGKPQLYGSQMYTDELTGKMKWWPVEKESELDQRRKAVGLEPIADYLKRFGMEYSFPRN